MQLNVDSDTLKQGAIAYQTYSHLFDALFGAAVLGVVSTVRYFVGKKGGNPNPSGAWYVPKIIGMLWAMLLALDLTAGGFRVLGFGGNPIVMVLFAAAALGQLYWAYRVIWRPVFQKLVV
jgi:hypothetical protein